MAFLADFHSGQFSKKQHSIVQRMLRALRKGAAQRLIAETAAEGYANVVPPRLPEVARRSARVACLKTIPGRNGEWSALVHRAASSPASHLNALG
jgi:hypothetical protein